jgi:hypothetical protein
MAGSIRDEGFELRGLADRSDPLARVLSDLRETDEAVRFARVAAECLGGMASNYPQDHPLATKRFAFEDIHAWCSGELAELIERACRDHGLGRDTAPATARIIDLLAGRSPDSEPPSIARPSGPVARTGAAQASAEAAARQWARP